MSALRFEWDPRKSRLNRSKHGVTFDEAESVFFDDNALLIDDPDHSEREERFVLLGFVSDSGSSWCVTAIGLVAT